MTPAHYDDDGCSMQSDTPLLIPADIAVFTAKLAAVAGFAAGVLIAAIVIGWL